MTEVIIKNKRAIQLVLATTTFIPPFLTSAINVALPTIGTEFQMDAVMLSWVSLSYLLSMCIALIPFGRWADISGRKRTFSRGLWMIAIFSFLSGSATSGPALILFRIFQGIGTAMIFSTVLAIVSSVFSASERGKAFGFNAAAAYLGLSSGPFIGGYLTQLLSWRAVLYFIVPVCFILIAMVKWLLKGEWAEAKGERFDVVGALIFGTAMVGLVFGLSFLPDFSAICLTAGGVLGLILFITWELKVKDPVFNPVLLRTNHVFAMSNLAAFISYAATFAVLFLLSLYLHHIKGLSPNTVGLLLIFQPLVTAFGSPLAGRLSDHYAPRLVAASGMTLTALSLFLYSFLNQATPLAYIISVQVLMGLGFSLFSSPNTNAAMGAIETRFYGLASGCLATMRISGMVISMALVTLVFTAYLGRVEIAPANHVDFLSATKLLFIIFAAMCTVAIFASLARKRHITPVKKHSRLMGTQIGEISNLNKEK